MTELDTPEPKAVTVELLREIPEHIRFKGSEDALCGEECADAEARTLSADTDPLSDASIHLCPDCADEWLDSEEDYERAPTVRCAVDRSEDGTMYTCCDVVAVDEARHVEHPDADEPIPVCPDCYDWLLDYPNSGITTPYEEADSWRDLLAAE